jgi:NAD(P)-dependent dehydrogenase (short-subunit alcohol dehydrogenase family)
MADEGSAMGTSHDPLTSFRLDGKVALVTGAARGIGAACARTLGAAGAAVLVADVLEETGRATVGELERAGIRAALVALDVTSEEAWSAAVATAIQSFGGLDVLVNNAGVETMRMITDTTLAEWRRVQSVNVDGVFLGCKHAIAAMRPGGAAGHGGSIVNLSSIAGLVGYPALSAYCASKGAVRLFTKAAAVECARLGLGVRVNSVHPGLIQTPMLDNLFRETVALGLAPDEQAGRDAIFAQQPMPEIRAVPQDIANVVLFLASDASRYVTGSEYVADGGMTAA